MWMSNYNWFGIQTVMPQDCKAHFKQHWSAGKKSDHKTRSGGSLCGAHVYGSQEMALIIFKQANGNVEQVVDSKKFRTWT